MTTPERNELYDATDNLINQQFYKNGSDRIIGRTDEVSLKIRNSGQIIAKFKDLFNRNLDLFLQGRYMDFLNAFKKIEGLNENVIEEIYSELKGKIEVLKGSDMSQVVLYTIVVSSLLSFIRDHHFNLTLKEIKRRAKRESSKDDQQIQQVLNELFMRNNDNVSILYNISYLDALAESYNYRRVAHTCKIQKGIYINRIVNIISNATNN